MGLVCDRLVAGGIGTRVSFPDGFNPTDTSALLGLTGVLPACLRQINTHMYDFVFANAVVPYGQGISIYSPAGSCLPSSAVRGGSRSNPPAGCAPDQSAACQAPLWIRRLSLEPRLSRGPSCRSPTCLTG